MGYIFQNIADLADFLLSRPENSGTDRKTSSPAGSGLFDFESTMRAVSARFGRDTAGIENADQRSTSFGVGRQADHQLAEPVVLDCRAINLLLSKSDGKVSLNISADDLALLLNREATGAWAGSEYGSYPGIRQLSDPPNSLEHQGKYRLIFAPADLSDNSYSVDHCKIPVTIETQGISSYPEYISISKLISLIRDYPNPLRMKVSVLSESDPTVNLKASAQDSNMKSEASFVFDLRLLYRAENTDDNTIRGLFIFPGEQHMADDVSDTLKSSLPPEAKIADHARGINPDSINSDSFKGTATPPWYESPVSSENATDLLRFPPFWHRSSLIGFGAAYGKTSDPAGNQTADDPIRGMTDYSSRSDNSDAVENPIRYHGRTLNSRLSDMLSSQRNIPGNTMQGSNADVINESILSYPKGDTGISKVPGIEMSEPYFRSILNLNELRSGILYAARLNLTQVTLKLYPEELGTVSVRLFWKDGVLSASMKTANAEAAQILSAGLTELRSGLENANLRVENLSVIMDNGREAGAFGSGIDAHSRKPGAELTDNNNTANRQFFAGPATGNHHKNLNTSIHATTHRGWIDLKA
jgi:hypothetical protein